LGWVVAALWRQVCLGPGGLCSPWVWWATTANKSYFDIFYGFLGKGSREGMQVEEQRRRKAAL